MLHLTATYKAINSYILFHQFYVGKNLKGLTYSYLIDPNTLEYVLNLFMNNTISVLTTIYKPNYLETYF